MSLGKIYCDSNFIGKDLDKAENFFERGLDVAGIHKPKSSRLAKVLKFSLPAEKMYCYGLVWYADLLSNPNYAKRDYKTAKIFYQKIIKNDDPVDQYPSLINLADLLSRDEMMPSAQDLSLSQYLLECAVDLEPNNAIAYNKLGLLFENPNRQVDHKSSLLIAKKFYEKSVTLDQSYSWCWLNKSLLEIGLGEKFECLASMARAKKILKQKEFFCCNRKIGFEPSVIFHQKLIKLASKLLAKNVPDIPKLKDDIGQCWK